MYFDHRIIARQSAGAGGLCVLAHVDTVHLRDGSSVQLHPIQANGLPMLTHRALVTTTGHMQLVDLARLVRQLDAELRACPKRDITGFVLYTLRQAFATAVQFNQAAHRAASGTWWPVADGYVWHPAPRAIDDQVLHIAASQAPEQTTLWGAAC